RFPRDILYSPVDHKVYTLVAASDVVSPNASYKVLSSRTVASRFEVYGGNVLINRDVTAAFYPLFQNENDIQEMSFTQLPDGTFALFANSRAELTGDPTYIGVVLTKDFLHFSTPQKIDTAF